MPISARALFYYRLGPWYDWHVVAGGVEPGETAVHAAKRELREETACWLRFTRGVEAHHYRAIGVVAREGANAGLPVTSGPTGKRQGGDHAALRSAATNSANADRRLRRRPAMFAARLLSGAF